MHHNNANKNCRVSKVIEVECSLIVLYLADDINKLPPQWQWQRQSTVIRLLQKTTTHQISFLNNMKYIFTTTALLLFAACNAFTSVPKLRHLQSVSCLSMSSSIPSETDDGYWSDEFEDDACWQNIYDDDCAMSTANLAFFKASTFLKGMPCAEGIEVC